MPPWRFSITLTIWKTTSTQEFYPVKDVLTSSRLNSGGSWLHNSSNIQNKICNSTIRSENLQCCFLNRLHELLKESRRQISEEKLRMNPIKKELEIQGHRYAKYFAESFIKKSTTTNQVSTQIVLYICPQTSMAAARWATAVIFKHQGSEVPIQWKNKHSQSE